MCYVMLQNEWQKLQGHMIYPRHLNKFVSGNQLMPESDTLSVIQRNHHVNYTMSIFLCPSNVVLNELQPTSTA